MLCPGREFLLLGLLLLLMVSIISAKIFLISPSLVLYNYLPYHELFNSEPTGKLMDQIYAQYSIYKGKASLSAYPVLPTFRKLEVWLCFFVLRFWTIFCFMEYYFLHESPLFRSLEPLKLIVAAILCWHFALLLVNASMTGKRNR